jgi:hypothetical protein
MEQVDYFVIVESVKTISGKPKPLNFRIENFELYRDKIRYLVLSEYPFPTDDAWRNERYQRDFVTHGLFDAADEDWILVSDLDEIPRSEAIKQFDSRRFLRGDFMQNAYSYYLNNQCFIDGESVVWPGSKIVTYKVFEIFSVAPSKCAISNPLACCGPSKEHSSEIGKYSGWWVAFHMDSRYSSNHSQTGKFCPPGIQHFGIQ